MYWTDQATSTGLIKFNEDTAVHGTFDCNCLACVNNGGMLEIVFTVVGTLVPYPLRYSSWGSSVFKKLVFSDGVC